MYLRWHMDYATGRVGESRRISYQALREHLEYHPARCSNEQSYYPSKQQVNRLLRKLEGRELIKRVHKGEVKESMVFLLVLASTDLNRPDEARHKRDTGSPTQGATQQKPVNTQAERLEQDIERDQSATQEARHTSDTSVKDLSLNAREKNFGSPDDWPIGEDLEFSDQFAELARVTGLPSHYTANDVRNLFNLFRVYGHRSYTAQSMTAWLADWRTWVQREKARYEKQPRSNPKQSGQSSNSGNSIASVLNFARNYGEPANYGTDGS